MLKPFILIVLALTGGYALPAPTPAIDTVLHRLDSETSPEQSQQIAEAIGASRQLKTDVEQLAASDKLTGIRIVQQSELKPVGGAHFNAYLDGTQVVIGAPLLKDLSNNLLIDVVREGDIRPNNTSFVLAHLAYHLRTRDEMNAHDDRVRRRIDALRKTTGSHDYTAIEREATWVRIADEASALISAWNDVIEDATARNQGRALSLEQVSTVLVNLRYRGIFLQAINIPRQLKFSDGGRIEPNEANIKALSTALASMALMDVQ